MLFNEVHSLVEMLINITVLVIYSCNVLIVRYNMFGVA